MLGLGAAGRRSSRLRRRFWDKLLTRGGDWLLTGGGEATLASPNTWYIRKQLPIQNIFSYRTYQLPYTSTMTILPLTSSCASGAVVAVSIDSDAPRGGHTSKGIEA